MPLKSDMTLDASKFDPKAISKQTHDFNAGLIKIMEGNPKWWEVGAAKFRQMRWNGETSLPKPGKTFPSLQPYMPFRRVG